MAFPYFPSIYQPAQMMPVQTPVAQVTPSNRSDFILVRSEEEARNYPVAFGNTVTFKDENVPYMYTKTMGMSQLDRPVFEKYKLVKETAPVAPTTAEDPKSDNEVVEKLKSEIDAIWREIEAIKNKALDEEGV